MSKFIKVTAPWKKYVLNANSILCITEESNGVRIETHDSAYTGIIESLEQIEAQLLRDEFAKAAMSGILANSSVDNLEAKDVAHDSYIFADAMLKERSK